MVSSYLTITVSVSFPSPRQGGFYDFGFEISDCGFNKEESDSKFLPPEERVGLSPYILPVFYP
jgi:hypothetical protein